MMTYHFKRSKRTKYGNKKTVIDGIKFDSIAEGNRYLELKMLEKMGEISDLKLQVKYELVRKSKHGRALYYVADFEYLDKVGVLVVEDVKGVKTPVYALKKRMLAEKYGIKIAEVKCERAKGAIY